MGAVGATARQTGPHGNARKDRKDWTYATWVGAILGNDDASYVCIYMRGASVPLREIPAYIYVCMYHTDLMTHASHELGRCLDG